MVAFWSLLASQDSVSIFPIRFQVLDEAPKILGHLTRGSCQPFPMMSFGMCLAGHKVFVKLLILFSTWLAFWTQTLWTAVCHPEQRHGIYILLSSLAASFVELFLFKILWLPSLLFPFFFFLSLSLFFFFPPLVSLFTQFRDCKDSGRFPAAYAQV